MLNPVTKTGMLSPVTEPDLDTPLSRTAASAAAADIGFIHLGSCEAPSAMGRSGQSCPRHGADGVRLRGEPGRPAGVAGWTGAAGGTSAAGALGQVPARRRRGGPRGPARRRVVRPGRGGPPAYHEPGRRAAAVRPGTRRILHGDRA